MAADIRRRSETSWMQGSLLMCLFFFLNKMNIIDIYLISCVMTMVFGIYQVFSSLKRGLIDDFVVIVYFFRERHFNLFPNTSISISF